MLASRLSKCCGGFAVCRPAHAHGFCSRVGRRHITHALHCALHTPVLVGLTWYLGAAVANTWLQVHSATTRAPVCCVFGKLMAARTDGAGCNGGRLPAAGDWAGDVHRDAARAPGRTKAGTADQRQSLAAPAAAKFACLGWYRAKDLPKPGISFDGGPAPPSLALLVVQSTRTSSFLPFCFFYWRDPSRGARGVYGVSRATPLLVTPPRPPTIK